MRTADAWRILGLQSTPTVEAVKRAYRALAKSLHPDAAGGAARPVAFARLTEAYEVALREAAAAQRHGAPERRPAPTVRRPSAPQRSAPPRQEGERVGRPRATPGSTTYDGAAPEDGDQPWDGAEWVGADSGTYWRVNPKEYADPRKHGAEYRARGKRPIRRDRSDASAARRQPTVGVEDLQAANGDLWPVARWRLFYALAGWIPWLAVRIGPLTVGFELLVFGLLVLAPRLAWSAAHGTAALLLLAPVWLVLLLIGVPIDGGGESAPIIGLVSSTIYVVVALLAAAGRLRARPWVAAPAG